MPTTPSMETNKPLSGDLAREEENKKREQLNGQVDQIVADLKEKNPNILDDEKVKKQIALEFENAVVETLVYKTKKAIEKYNIKTLIVAGGVSANKYLKKELKKSIKNIQNIYFPDKKLSGDNALMIGIAGYFKFLKNNKKTTRASKIKAEGGLRL